MTDTMKLWNAVSMTDPKYVKKVNQRGGFSAVCAQSQIMAATAQWGPCGGAWGPTNVRYERVEASGETLILCTIDLRFPEGGLLEGTAAACPLAPKGRVDAEAWKKARTNALTKALSQLGFNADVFLGLFDDNQYVQHAGRQKERERREKHEKAQAKKQDPDLIEGEELAAALADLRSVGFDLDGEEAAGLAGWIHKQEKAGKASKRLLGEMRTRTWKAAKKASEARAKPQGDYAFPGSRS